VEEVWGSWVFRTFPLGGERGLWSASFLGITADEDYGGLAMGYQAHCIVMEEVSKASGSCTVLFLDKTRVSSSQVALDFPTLRIRSSASTNYA
jgi:isovaleryl-CoA dehydrogenase